ncbi:hypothetical protein NC652_030162 [Populus alba x Populus x berolinensis]|nr:hypothetical protein NC652_030162 [Populus alba x Populus x berolinensis]
MGPVLTGNITVHTIWYGRWEKIPEKDYSRVHQLNLNRQCTATVSFWVVENCATLHRPNWSQHLTYCPLRTGKKRQVLFSREVFNEDVYTVGDQECRHGQI